MQNWWLWKIDGCGKLIDGKNIANLVSHIKHTHILIYAEKLNPVAVDAKSLDLKRLELIQACVEIVTVNGRPFNCLTDSGFQNLISDKLHELEDNGKAFKIDLNHYDELKKYII